MFHKTLAVVWLPLHKTPYLFMHLSCGFILTHKRSCQISYEEKSLGSALALFCFFLVYIYIHTFIVISLVSCAENSLRWLFELTE